MEISVKYSENEVCIIEERLFHASLKQYVKKI